MQNLRNKMVNTEKPQTKAAKKNEGIVENSKINKKQEVPKVETKKEVKIEEKNKAVTENKPEEKKETDSNKKVEEKKEAPKAKPVKKTKKQEVEVNARSVRISTKYSVAICKFLRGKRIEDAIKDLEDVMQFKKAVPMKGEIPHRRGKIMSGRFPKRAAKEFIVLLKSLSGNANNHEMNDPVIFEAMSNKASRPYGRFGRWQRKRTHITIKAREKKIKSKEKTKEKK